MGRFSCNDCRNKTCLESNPPMPCAKVEMMLPGPLDGDSVGGKLQQLNFLSRELQERLMARGLRKKRIGAMRTRLDSIRLLCGKMPKGKARRIAEAYFWLGLSRDEICQRMHAGAKTVSRLIRAVKRRQVKGRASL